MTVAAVAADDPGIQIADVRARLLRAAISEPISMSFGGLSSRSTLLVEVTGAEGQVGFGESWVNYPPWAATERFATLRDGVVPLVTGQDATQVQTLQARLKKELGPLGTQWGAPGPIMQAISGIDIALWDLLARQSSVPISDLFGGANRDRIAGYASSLGPENVERLARLCADRGFRGVKLKVGFGFDVDRDNLSRARRILGPDVELMVDANQAWGLDAAAQIAPVLEDVGVAWVEEPIRGNGLRDLERLFESTGMAIATGENVYGLDNFRAYLASPAVSIIQPDVTKVGGLTEAVEVCRMAADAGKPVIPHVYGGAVALLATLQVAAACPVIQQVEYDVRDNPLRDPLLREPPTFVDGSVTLPSGIGLGSELDMQVVHRYEVK
jgi:L-alanine-DL-glutamate epimerase-like enolase superfamily enzyme